MVAFEPVITPIVITKGLIAETTAELLRAGVQRRERMLVWIGRREGNEITIERVYVPAQRSGMDFFWLPPASMTKLMAEVRCDRSMVAAQVHTHPREAFHSAADDKWAVIRHEGALSLVVPEFARHTSPETFYQDAAGFVLSATNRWIEIPTVMMPHCYRITV